eukprot:TRINITY_DN4675_c0_g1::TRINITY_DN4675_c0_g1_i1::g.19575::m.19575 TRINITY_DN4675_c0_g1::TRINITY_DN4675_c0_g1_i1::g.19575  ORF type:complete len:575 (+),score=105.93,sp/Q9P4X3/UTP7_SCHPO/49.41/8e-170,BING4CT/PF08149.6/1.2e+04,BING4CT/PF08149.6/4.2e+03,BING4CT/PF08149.6/6.9e+02,BING4CT/PF08149.6/1.8e-34,WD40/PF00400.27/6.5e+02,WD40/PF00400.27/60,WD40/PF00400.27/3.8e-06,WD40/PF00400.27/8.8e+02,Coatomer_WDAD/PF04053.9/0.028 TRINITY_DN4675_c0_g1_i1:58-1725(+)
MGPLVQDEQRKKNKQARKLDDVPDKVQLKTGARAKKYTRGDKITLKGIDDKKLKRKLKRTEILFSDAAVSAARAEILLPEDSGALEAEGLEKTYHFRQDQIVKHLDIQSAQKVFDLKLDNFGPYRCSFTRNGRYLALIGEKGHFSVLDWSRHRLISETHLRESCRDVTFLHNEKMIAVAQKKNVYIYDTNGTEIHRLRNHIDVNRLDFLPYHFLLVSVGNAGYIKYQDTSTGDLVAEWRTKLGACHVMRQNPYNAISLLGHSNGTVTMWSPSMSTPLVKMLCHRGAVQALAVDQSGTYMVTAGLDNQVKVWDVRKYGELHSYFTAAPAHSLDISQSGILAVGYNNHVQMWKDALSTKAQSPYMNHHQVGSRIEVARFCPYEDVLGLGHADGYTSIMVPGSGLANYDALEANPYQTPKQRNETEIHQLLEKIPSDMISLEPNFVGNVRRGQKEMQGQTNRDRVLANKGDGAGAGAAEGGDGNEEEGAENTGEEGKVKRKTRGRSSTAKRFHRKTKNIVTQKRIELQDRIKKKHEKRKIKHIPAASGALGRFYNPKK